MIPTIIPITEDEMFVSWLNRLATVNVYRTDLFADRFLKYEQQKKILGVGNLDMICEKEKGSELFPDVRAIIYRHTTAFADQVYFSFAWQAKAITRMIHGRGDFTVSDHVFCRTYKPFRTRFCPLCKQEDLDEYRRIIAHVPHQARGISACWKHGVLLDTDEPVEASQAEKDTAVFARQLYLSDIFTDFGQIGRCIEKAGGKDIAVIRDAMNKGYIDDTTKASSFKGSLSRENNAPKSLVGYLAFLFHDAENLRKALDECGNHATEATFRTEIGGKYILDGEYGMVVRLICLECGNVFHAHPEAVVRGVGCPVCDAETDTRVLLNRYARHLGAGYTVRPSADRPVSNAVITHSPCGCSRDIPVYRLIWNSNRCPKCHKRTGEEGRSREGKKITIVRYGNCRDIDVEFEDGTIVTGKTYQDFIEGWIHYPGLRIRGAPKKDRVGERRRAKNGLMMEIVAYRNANDIDIRFEDGTVVTGKSYKRFLTGDISHPGIQFGRVPRINRVGETSLTKTGRVMTIIRYGNASDIDIRFDDGTVLEHKSYKRFREGNILHPNDKIHMERLGETNRASNGMMMKIIRYGSSDDIDIQFEDGTIAAGRNYRDFKKGTIRHPAKR